MIVYRVYQLCIVLFFASDTLVAADRVLVVGSGGWMSCRQGVQDQFIAPHFHSLLNNLRHQFPETQFDFLLTCSPGLAAAHGSRPIEYYYRSMSTCQQGQVAACEIGRLVQKFSNSTTHLFLIGHSHGGWHAMHAASALNRVDGLFTIEPISAAQCDTRAFLQNRSPRWSAGPRSPVAACRQAPCDVDYQSILTVTSGNWHNYFLAPGQPRGDLHSSAAGGAINHAFFLEGDDRAHHRLGLDSRVWSHILQEISHSMAFPMSMPSSSESL